MFKDNKNTFLKNMMRFFTVSFLCFMVAACAAPMRKAERHEEKNEWLRAVVEYRKASNDDPRNIEYKTRLKQATSKASDYYYHQGVVFFKQDKLDEAIGEFQQGLAAMPDDERLSEAMNVALAKREANKLYMEGLLIEEAGNKEEAKRIFHTVSRIYPDHKGVAESLARLQKKNIGEHGEEPFALTSKAPITLNFRQADMRAVFEFVGKSFGMNIVFDEASKSATPITLFAKDVTFEQALSLILASSKTFYKKVSKNTLLIMPDTKDKRGQYEDHVMRTFYLSTMRAKEMADILRVMMAIRKMVVNEQLNTLVVRDTEEVIRQAEKLIDLNDRKPAEMILEVEILEMNRTKAERLGLDLGSYQIGASLSAPGTIPLNGSISGAIEKTAVLTLPSATFRFFKQDVDARTLANPKIRVLNGRSAKIHIGDRVPLRVSTIVNTTGQVNTTYDYKEIGIKLSVDPTINLDNSTMVKLSLEVSSLGANLGTTAEPAFRIGTRNAETFMLLRDGETAILGGLIRDEDRNTVIKVPLLGDIPAAGSLFSSFDSSKERTDVLLTITPRVVRGWQLPATETRQFYSGTEEKYLDQEPFKSLTLPLPEVAKESDTPQIKPQLPATGQPVSPSASSLDNGAAAGVRQPVVFGLANSYTKCDILFKRRGKLGY